MIAVSVIAALAAALSNSLAAYFQQGADKQLETDESVPPSKIPVLLRKPRWLAGQGFDISAFLCQAVALGFGTLLFVEPLMVMSLPSSVGLRAWSARKRPGRLGVTGSALVVVGISVFLAVGQPTAGGATISNIEAMELGIAVGVMLGGLLTWAWRSEGNTRAVAFAAGAGTIYGVTAGLTKVVTTELQHGGVLSALGHWPLYAAIAAGVTGVMLTQNALKPGALAAPVAVITIADPLAAIAIGLLWLGEKLTAAPWAIALEVITIGVMALGVVVLAQQSESASAPSGEDGERAPAAEHR